MQNSSRIDSGTQIVQVSSFFKSLKGNDSPTTCLILNPHRSRNLVEAKPDMSSVRRRWRDDVHQQSYVDMMDMNWGIKISITNQQNLVLKIGWSTPKANA